MFQENLTAFYKDFSVVALLAPNKHIHGLFGHAYVEIKGVSSRKAIFTCIENEIAGIQLKQRVNVHHSIYHVVAIKPDGTGLVTLALELAYP